jgi:hypothetical protein
MLAEDMAMKMQAYYGSLERHFATEQERRAERRAVVGAMHAHAAQESTGFAQFRETQRQKHRESHAQRLAALRQVPPRKASKSRTTCL